MGAVPEKQTSPTQEWARMKDFWEVIAHDFTEELWIFNLKNDVPEFLQCNMTSCGTCLSFLHLA